MAEDVIAPPVVDPHVLRSVMASYPTGVTIVTSSFNGALFGMAANSFTSVSLEPPLVLWCPLRGALTSEATKRSGRFAIHILRHDQVGCARAFVGDDARRFDVVEHEIDANGVPILKDWLALIVCDVYGVTVAGDHEIVLGEVVRCEKRDAAPLLFHESALRMLPRLPPLKATGPEIEPDDRDEDLYDSLVRVLAPPH